METHVGSTGKDVSNHMLFPQVKEVSDKKQNGQLNPFFNLETVNWPLFLISVPPLGRAEGTQEMSRLVSRHRCHVSVSLSLVFLEEDREKERRDKVDRRTLQMPG